MSPSGLPSSPRLLRARTSRTSSPTSVPLVPPPLLVVLPPLLVVMPLLPPLRRRRKKVKISLINRCHTSQILTISCYREGGVRRGHGLRSLRLNVSQRFRSASRIFFLLVFLVTSLLSDLASSTLSYLSVPDTPHSARRSKREKAKKKNIRTKTSFGTGRCACIRMMDYVMAEVLDRMTLGFRLLGT